MFEFAATINSSFPELELTLCLQLVPRHLKGLGRDSLVPRLSLVLHVIPARGIGNERESGDEFEMQAGRGAVQFCLGSLAGVGAAVGYWRVSAVVEEEGVAEPGERFCKSVNHASLSSANF